MSQLNVNTISPQSGSNIKITGTISGSNMNLSGDVTAQRFVVSSSITKLVTITNSGSTAFGDSLDDTHIYTGSLQLTGSLTASKFSGDGSGITNVAYSNVVSRPTLISGSAQIATEISGAFTSTSSSLASRITNFSTGNVSLISGSATSTGSFGKLFGDGSSLTNISSYTVANSANNRVLTAVDSENGNAEANLTFDGTILSGSLASSASFGRVEATTIGGNSPLTIESDNFNVRADGTISGSANSTASFGKAKFDRTVAIGDQALNAIGNYTLWVEDHDNGNGIYATDQSFFDNMKIYNDFFLNQESAYATIKVSANNRGLLLDPSYGGSYTGDIFHRATGHRFFPKGSVTKGEELFVITGSHFQSSSVMLSGSGASTASFGRVEATTIAGNSPLTIESDNFNVKSDGTISGSANSTASFGKGRFDRTVAIGDQALNAIGNYTLWVEDHDNGNGIYASDQSFFDNVKIYNNFFLNQESAYATIKVSANNRGLLLDASYNGSYTGDIFHRATGHRFFPRGSVTKGEELFVITGSHHTSASVMLSGSGASTGSFGIIENNTQIAGFRPIINQTADFSASLSNAGRYHIVHGNITCSIGTDSDMPVTIGAEYEFFQSSSVGNFLFQTGSGVSLFSKNDNRNIAGQYSGATLKKVAADTFHLVGDLT